VRPLVIGSSLSATDDLLKLIAAQALVRGFLERRKYKISKLTIDNGSKYFKAIEAQETLDRKATYEEGVFQHRELKYSTGAVYNGEWMGGLRHGLGEMEWADGASYVGAWKHGQASGEGKFFHVSGDEYAGGWYNNMTHGKGEYTARSGASYNGDWKEN
jgi:hypothetical protein